MVDLLGGPAADMTAAMQEDFEQADDAGVVDLDPGIADRADGDRQGEALQLVAQEGGELFVLLEEGVLEVGAEDVMTVLTTMKWPTLAFSLVAPVSSSFLKCLRSEFRQIGLSRWSRTSKRIRVCVPLAGAQARLNERV